jgi:hypothetical protein
MIESLKDLCPREPLVRNLETTKCLALITVCDLIAPSTSQARQTFAFAVQTCVSITLQFANVECHERLLVIVQL